MPESGSLGSVRGALSNGHPYRDLGIVGAFVATFLGQAVGWYRAGEGAGLIGAVAGAVIVLAIWGAIASRRSSTL